MVEFQTFMHTGHDNPMLSQNLLELTKNGEPKENILTNSFENQAFSSKSSASVHILPKRGHVKGKGIYGWG